ncbi:MAG: hypothetical protein MH472_04450 [Bacteroidia bacterium]|nr:hypothetical protein [Bacteroidia bacterium]
MKYHNIITSFAILSSALFYGCLNDCKDYKPRDEYNAISPDRLRFVPYLGEDTLCFLRNNTDTITFYGTGKKKIVTVENGDLGACGPTSILHNDNYKYTFISNDVADKIIIEIRFPGYLDFYFLNNRFVSNLASLRAPFAIPEISINGHTYMDVDLIFSNVKDTIYYNNEVGIIKFGFQSGAQWILLK